jgi:hypothetical protein
MHRLVIRQWIKIAIGILPGETCRLPPCDAF